MTPVTGLIQKVMVELEKETEAIVMDQNVKGKKFPTTWRMKRVNGAEPGVFEYGLEGNRS